MRTLKQVRFLPLSLLLMRRHRCSALLCIDKWKQCRQVCIWSNWMTFTQVLLRLSKHRKDLLLPHLRLKKKQSQRLSEWELCNSAYSGILVNGDVFQMMFVCFSPLGSALASICPQRPTPKHYWTFCCFCLSFSFCSKHHLPPISFVFFPFFTHLYPHLSLINTYCRLYLPW